VAGGCASAAAGTHRQRRSARVDSLLATLTGSPLEVTTETRPVAGVRRRTRPAARVPLTMTDGAKPDYQPGSAAATVWTGRPRDPAGCLSALRLDPDDPRD